MDFHIKFWSRHDWVESKKVGTEMAKFFVETEEGSIVNEDRLDDICKYARKIWETFAMHHQLGDRRMMTIT